LSLYVLTNDGRNHISKLNFTESGDVYSCDLSTLSEGIYYFEIVVNKDGQLVGTYTHKDLSRIFIGTRFSGENPQYLYDCAQGMTTISSDPVYDINVETVNFETPLTVIATVDYMKRVQYTNSEGKTKYGYTIDNLYADSNKRAYIISTDSIYGGFFWRDTYTADNNVANIRSVFESARVSVEFAQSNVSGSQFSTVQTQIQRNAHWNDVTYIYLSAHGNESHYDENGESLEGIVFKDGVYTYISICEWVKYIKGRVVFIVDACYSGQFIEWASGANNTEQVEYGLDERRFTILTATQSSQTGTMIPDGSIFTTNVTTSCTEDENGRSADINNDGMVSIQEIYEANRYYEYGSKNHEACFWGNDLYLFE